MPSATVYRPDNSDPLAHITAPPPGETEQQRFTRLAKEAEAKRISDAIDEELREQERAAKKNAPIKILLLGQSESGKSTTLKNFQLMNSPRAFKAERGSWRAVIQLNVIRSIRLILEAIADVQAAAAASQHNAHSRTPTPGGGSSSSSSPRKHNFPRLTPEHLKLRLRLLPLLQIEETLIKKLTPAGSGEYEATHLGNITNVSGSPAGKMKEVAINSQFAWKGVFSKFISAARDSTESDVIDWEDPNDPGRVIHACGEDMIKLWHDPVIKQVLRHQKLRLEDMPGFFLNSLDRITQLRYVPTTDDILNARLKTLGVTEYKFTIREENRLGLGSATREWKIFDVGGQRSLRAAWAPYFDDVNVILFLAPISAFDQMLAEDPTVNRIEDSILLWKTIVSNPLLFKTNLVLFLNKTDILKAKLRGGIRVSDYILSYGKRPNDYENASAYLKKKFQQVLKEHGPRERVFYSHFTSVTDPKQTSHVLTDVQDTIVRRNLMNSHLVAS